MLKFRALAMLLLISITGPAMSAKQNEIVPFSTSDMKALFGSDADSIKIAMLSSEEMQNTEGAWVPFVVSGALGFGMYAFQNWYAGRSITWQGSIYSIGTGAFIGGGGGMLIRAAGGGVAGNIAWRPSMMSSAFGAAQYRNYRGW